MNIMFSSTRLILFSLITLFIFSNTYAETYKCVDSKGNTIFQDSPCSGDKKETKIELKSSRSISIQSNQCTQSCDIDNTLCRKDFEQGVNTIADPKDLSLCENNKMTCYDICIDKSVDRELEELELTTQQNYTYDRELNYKRSLEREVRYQAFWENRDEKRDQKSIRRNCSKYKKKLAKIKGQWKRKQRAGWKPKDEEKYRIKIENAEDVVRIECQP